MTARPGAIAAGLTALCAGLVAWKVLALGYSFGAPERELRWRVQVAVAADGRGERVRVHLALPSGAEAVRVHDEQFSAPGLKLAVRTRKAARVATFSGDVQPSGSAVSVRYSFSAPAPRGGAAATAPDGPGGEAGAGGRPPDPARAADTASSETVPAEAPAVRAKAAELTAGAADETARARALYDFVLDEVAAAREIDTALEALERFRGNPAARARLFAALARAAGLPARVVHAVPLAEGLDRQLLVRNEVLLDGRWTAVDAVRGRFGADAAEGFVLQRGDGDPVRVEGLDAPRVSVAVAREVRLSAAEPERLSLQALSPRAQLGFRVLLLVPLGALVVALFRNLVGVPTFGTFLPILVALALRETRPLPGLLLLGTVIAAGFAGRKLLERLRLLIVPRLSLLLTLVIFVMAAATLATERLGGDPLAVLPMVIMTMLVERLGVVLAEEGTRSALKTAGGTVLVGAVAYALFQSATLQRWVAVFPELNLLVVAALLLLGRYTGYRLSELVRFRALAGGAQ